MAFSVNSEKPYGVSLDSAALNGHPRPTDRGYSLTDSSFDFGRANEAQRRAITTTDGPVLITAGPGTGKTFTLVQRVLYLIQERGVKPEEIFVATFTEKAAKELVTRLTNELDARAIAANLTEMYVGTFHSLALRIIKENLEYSRLKQGFRVLDDFEQQYCVYRKLHEFRNMEGFTELFPGQKGGWAHAGILCKVFNEFAEELVDSEQLAKDTNPLVANLGMMYGRYRKMLADENLLDFSSIQVEAFRILTEYQQVREAYRSVITHLMVDEYQDTNYIQEQLVFLLAGERKNLCVVGDDDQGLYRFRGATIRNIIEFPSKFAPDECKVVPLVENYRSHPSIVDCYNTWMETTQASDKAGKELFGFDWDKYRYPKTIQAVEADDGQTRVLSLTTPDSVPPSEEAWHREVLGFIRDLTERGQLSDLNQIAFLFRSVKGSRAARLAEYLEANGIAVYSPRSNLFFDREEIKIAVGCLLALFPNYVNSFESGQLPEWFYGQAQEGYRDWLVSCIEAARDAAKNGNGQLLAFIREYQDEHLVLTGNTDYAYAALFYRILGFDPFASWMDTPTQTGLADSRPVRNLAILTQMLGRFEHIYSINVLSGKKDGHGKRRIDALTETFFNTYLRLLWKEGIGEYEEMEEYAPSGCVSFLTIHQSKGMEFPVVVVDSFDSVARKQSGTLPKSVSAAIETRHYHRKPFEPEESIKFFDFWRLYYTAFSRAQNLLILAYPKVPRTPSKYFKHLLEPLKPVQKADLAAFGLAEVKPVNIKQAFSFTSHITVYETCSVQYRFFKDLGFQPVRVNAQLFGTLIHQTIEDVHRAALRDEAHLITDSNVNTWFDANYTYLSKAERTYLAQSQLDFARASVHRYVKRQGGDWSAIKQAEVDVSLVKPDYILEGTVDLIRGEGNTVEIVDFKSSRKPDMRSDKALLERYRRQLHIYAHLVEQRTGEKVSKLHLYYTGEAEESNPQISWKFSPTAVEGTVAAFDDTAHRILARDYSHKAEKTETCKNCDLRAWCGGG